MEKISIKGYRALKAFEISLPLGRPLVLIGENGSGKSTILDAIAIIGELANGRGGQAIKDRDGWAAISWAGAGGDIELAVRFSDHAPPFDKDGGPVEYAVRLAGPRMIPTIVDEEVRIYKKAGPRTRPFVALKGGHDRWAANVQNNQRDVVAPTAQDGSAATASVLAAISDENRYPTPVHVKQALQSIAFYPAFAFGRGHAGDRGSDPLAARAVEQTTRIASDGRDLLTALYTMSQEHGATWEALLSDLRAVFPWCDKVRFPAAPGRGQIMLSWVDRRSGATMYLHDMSEGMRVYLALLAALHAQDSPALLAFDEPERSLHPRAMARLVKVIESRAEQVPIMIATHADRLLDFLEDPAAVLRITRFSGAEGVSIEELDRATLDAWLKDYSLSELRARNLLEAPVDSEEPMP